MEVWMNKKKDTEVLYRLFVEKKGAIFDMDGTLIDSMGMWHMLDIEYLGRFGITPEPDFQQVVAPMTLAAAAAYMHEHFRLPCTPEEITRDFMQMVSDAYRYTLPLKKGVLPLIKRLYKNNISMTVATANEYEVTYPALERTGVVPYIKGLVTCTMAGSNKETPAVYELACRKMGLGVSDCVVFEDSLFAIKTAKSAGFTVVAVYDREAEDKWDEITDLTDYQVRFS